MLVPDAQFFASHSLKNFFESGSTTDYTLPVAQAIRQDDVATLERLWLLLPNNNNNTPVSILTTPTPPLRTTTGCKIAKVRPSDPTTHDSMMHLACRRNAATVLTFLLQHGVSVRYRGDYCGRTPLHEAWYVMWW